MSTNIRIALVARLQRWALVGTFAACLASCRATDAAVDQLVAELGGGGWEVQRPLSSSPLLGRKVGGGASGDVVLVAGDDGAHSGTASGKSWAVRTLRYVDRSQFLATFGNVLEIAANVPTFSGSATVHNLSVQVLSGAVPDLQSAALFGLLDASVTQSPAVMEMQVKVYAQQITAKKIEFDGQSTRNMGIGVRASYKGSEVKATAKADGVTLSGSGDGRDLVLAAKIASYTITARTQRVEGGKVMSVGAISLRIDEKENQGQLGMRLSLSAPQLTKTLEGRFGEYINIASRSGLSRFVKIERVQDGNYVAFLSDVSASQRE